MIACDLIQQRQIRQHYDWATLFYRLLWGRHIHHGFWNADESPALAQLQLMERLATLAQVTPGARVLDVGCGMGGSSIHLAKMHECQVVGLTLSPLQRWWARNSARWHGAARRTEFRCQDAERAEFSPGEFDILWSIECTEHLFDKAAFFRRAARWVKPGGRVAICAWLASESAEVNAEHRQQVYDVCEGFLCPSLGTVSDYIGWFEAAGLPSVHFEDWTSRVDRTWEICANRVRRSRVQWLARAIDPRLKLFLDRFDTILRAYRSGAMQYGCFIAQAPIEQSARAVAEVEVPALV